MRRKGSILEFFLVFVWLLVSISCVWELCRCLVSVGRVFVLVGCFSMDKCFRFMLR